MFKVLVIIFIIILKKIQMHDCYLYKVVKCGHIAILFFCS